MSLEEAKRIQRENLAVYTLEDHRSGALDVDAELTRLPNPVYLTLDVDVFDWSVVRSTGTPEPGGFCWDEATELLQKIFNKKMIIGFDVVELAHDRHDRNSAFAVAKIIYKMMGYKLAAEIHNGSARWPENPAGPFFSFPEAPLPKRS
jgi:agmatinase